MNNDEHIATLNEVVNTLITEVQRYIQEWNYSNRECEDKLQAVMYILRAVKLLECDD